LGDGTEVSRSTPAAISDINYDWKVATPVFSVAAGTYSVEKIVTITCATSGAAIHYTLDGATPTEFDPTITSGSTVTIDETQTLKARAFASGMPTGDVASASYVLAVASITLSPTGGTYTSARMISMATTSPGVTIRYTVDGTTPAESSTVYSTPLTVGTSTTVKAIGFRFQWTTSAVVSATYTMNFGTLAAPVFSPGTGTYTSEAVVSLSALAGATIRYTTNGSAPTTSSPVYGIPLVLTATTPINAKAFHPDYIASATSTATYTIAVATPVLSPTAGTYVAGQGITASTATPGATLTFTTNGVAPTSASTLFPAGGIVAGNFTVKLAAWKAGATPSAVVTAVYEVTGTLTAARIVGGEAHSLASRPDGLAFGWGTNTSWQVGDGTNTTRNLPVIVSGASGVVGLAAGDFHSVAVMSNGTAVAWGYNGSGRLGDGTTTSRPVATAVQGLSSVAAVDAGESHTLALKTDGTVWAWGYNAAGQLGNGTTTQQLTPGQASVLTNVTAISAGGSSSFAVGSTGTVWSWGGNGNGQLGSGNTTSRSTPGQISGLSTATAISTGGSHTLALLNDGTVKAWGYNLYGQVGDGTRVQRTSPASVSGLSTAIAIAAGSMHSLVLLGDGTVWAWGSNANAAIGDGSTETMRLTPVVVSGLPSVVAIGAGSYHSLAIAADGSVWAWGRNVDSQLGDGTTTLRTTPVQIAGPDMIWKVAAPVLSLESGLYSTAQTVTVTCTDPDAVLRYTTSGIAPTEAAPVVASGGSISVDQSLTLTVRAWKAGAVSSEIVSGAYELKVIAPTLSPASGPYASAQSVSLTSATPSATFTYTTDGTEPGVSSAAYSSTITVVDTRSIKGRAYKAGWTPSDSTTASYWISAGTVATPTITPTGGTMTTTPLVALACTSTGATIRFTLDGSDPTAVSAPYQFPFLIEASTTLRARAFKSGFAASAIASATYALDSTGQTARPLVVPGGGRYATSQTVHVTGPVGATLRYTTTGADPTNTDTVIPVSGDLVVGQSEILKVRAWLTGSDPSAVRRADFVITGAISSGRRHTLALASDGQVWAWGRNTEGQVGMGSYTVTLTTPVAVLTNTVAVAGNGWSSLAVRADGTVWNWGTLAATGVTSAWPVQVAGLTDVAAVAAGWTHALALKRDGTVWAWGTNTSGQLGDGTSTNHTTPAPVLGLSGVTSIAAGDGYSLAVQGDGAAGGLVWAWGKNTTGQLGDGSQVTRLVPVRVIGLDTVAQVAAGEAFAVARLADGTVRAWGADAFLQLGDNSAGTSAAPVAIPVLSHVVWIAAGLRHAVTIDDEGRVWGWGSNAFAQLGQPNYDGVAGVGAPVVIPEGTAGMAASAGEFETLLLRTDGTVWYTGAASLTPDHLVVMPSLTLANNASLFVDTDTDGLLGWEEYLAGTDALRADTNGNGLSDLVDVRRHSQSANPDDDGDGVPNVVEVARGTDPFRVDSDGDGVSDLADAFPLDATRWLAPVADPNDHTPPVIILTYPTTARPIGDGL
jgi:alpha-tubulin suppressor-like RCC1 family protein